MRHQIHVVAVVPAEVLEAVAEYRWPWAKCCLKAEKQQAMGWRRASMILRVGQDQPDEAEMDESCSASCR